MSAAFHVEWEDDEARAFWEDAVRTYRRRHHRPWWRVVIDGLRRRRNGRYGPQAGEIEP